MPGPVGGLVGTSVVLWYPPVFARYGVPMSPEHRLRLWALVVAEARGTMVAVEHVCAVSVTVTGADSAAVAVSLRSTPREVLWASDRVASRVAELTVTFGEGPSVEATSGGPALAGDLTVPYCQARWPAFAPAAVASGVRAVFALPLQIGGIHLGVLDLLPRACRRPRR